MEELNARSVTPCSDPLAYASLRAEPDYSTLGKRLGKAMGSVAKEVKSMSQADILAFEKSGEATLVGHRLKLSDIKVVREFKRPANMVEKDIDAAGDGDVLVVLDLRPDESLFEAGVAREVINRVQKLRKKAGLEPTDLVEVYYASGDGNSSVLDNILCSQGDYIRDVIGCRLMPSTSMPAHAVLLCLEKFSGISGMTIVVSLTRPALAFDNAALLNLYSGNKGQAEYLKAFLLSRDHSNLKSEFNATDGKMKVDIVDDLPPSEIVLGEHLFLSNGEYHLSAR